MSYAWSTIIGKNAKRYHLGVGKALAKRFADERLFIRELYYSQVVHEQPWASGGFLKPLGWYYHPEQSEYIVFYPYAESVDDEKIVESASYSPPGDYRMDNLVFALYWLARSNLFALFVEKDQLRAIDKYVVLADYQFYSLDELELLPEQFREKVQRINPDPSRRAQSLRSAMFDSFTGLFGQLCERIINTLTYHSLKANPIRRSSLMPPLSEYIEHFYRAEREWSTQENKKIGAGVHGCVYAPPINCPTQLSGRFVGKLFKSDGAERELDGVRLLDEVDPRGEFHAKLVNQCKVVMPDDCSTDELGEDKETTELVYEYRGKPLGSWVLSSDPVHRLRFYVGLDKLISNVVKMNNHNVYHLDLRYDNIVADEHYNLSIIDHGTIVKGDDINWRSINECGYLYYPLEVGLADTLGSVSTEHAHDKWSSNVEYSRQSGEPFDDVLMKLNDCEKSEQFVDKIDNLFKQLTELAPSKRLEWIQQHLDLYSLGYSLAVDVAHGTEYFDELKPVLHHLVVYDIDERDIMLAQRELRKLIDKLERQTAVPFTD